MKGAKKNCFTTEGENFYTQHRETEKAIKKRAASRKKKNVFSEKHKKLFYNRARIEWRSMRNRVTCVAIFHALCGIGWDFR